MQPVNRNRLSVCLNRSKLLLVTMLLAFASGQGQAQPAEGKRFTISTVNTPITAELKRLFARVYERVGLTPNYVDMPIARRLIELNDGTVDADLAARASASEQYENIIRVGPPVGQIDLHLLCPIEQPCNSNTLRDIRITVYMNRGVESILRNDLGIAIYTKIGNMENTTSNSALFNHKRIDYMIYSVFNGDQAFAITRPHTSLLLGSQQFYHFINSRHIDLAAQLADAIEAELALVTHSSAR